MATLDTVHVPIGCGSAICGIITVRDLLGLKTKIVSVVSTEAQAAKLSFENGRLTETASADTIADGMAVHVPVAEAFALYSKGADRIVAISETKWPKRCASTTATPIISRKAPE